MSKLVINLGGRIPKLKQGLYMARLSDETIVVSPLPIDALKKRLGYSYRDNSGEYCPLYNSNEGALKELIIENMF